MRARIVPDAGHRNNHSERVADALRLIGGGTMNATLRNLVEMFDDDQLVDWRTMAVFGVPNELLELAERELVRRAHNSSASIYRESGVSPRELLFRVISLLSIEDEVESRLNGQSSFQARKRVVVNILDSAG